MTKNTDFLRTRSDNAIRRELLGIRESYHHFWDLLSELIQNSRDSITRARNSGRTGPFFIHVTLDAASRLVEVFDNGFGIDPEKVNELLAPGGGDKSAHPKEVGEKGVGLTYVVFSGNQFEIESRQEGKESFVRKVTNAASWLKGSAPELPALSSADAGSRPSDLVFGKQKYSISSFARVMIASVTPVDDGLDIFSLTATQLRFLVRTKTAVGVTRAICEENWMPEFDTYVTVENSSDASPVKLEAGFPTLHTFLESHELSAIQKLFLNKTEVARRKILRDKAVWSVESVTLGGESIDVYGVMMPNNRAFMELAEGELKLVGSTKKDSDSAVAESLFGPGIFIATKGMPTGVEIPNGPGSKYPAYYRRCFFLVESARVRFDLGRKSMHHTLRARLQSAVNKMFTQFEDLAKYQGDERISQNSVDSETKAEREKRKKKEWKTFRELVEHPLVKIPFRKVPGGQEAAVAAIFHEMLGARLLKGYVPLASGYANQYDLHALYVDSNGEEQELLVEYKYDLSALVRDFEIGRKFWDDIHLLVAWKADSQKLKTAGFLLQSVSKPPYDGVNFEIEIPIPGLVPIPVILLEDLLKALAKS